MLSPSSKFTEYPRCSKAFAKALGEALKEESCSLTGETDLANPKKPSIEEVSEAGAVWEGSWEVGRV